MASSVLPNDFLERVSTLYPLSLHPNILSTFSAKRPIAFRVNTLLTDRESVLDEIRKAGIVLRDVEWYQDAFVTDSFDAKALTSLPLYKEGKIYIQNLSSMIPPLVMDIKKGDTILDLCAAPGSKTSQIATFLSGTGELVACDKSRDRLFKLQANLKQQGVTEVKLVLKPGEIVWKWYPEYFDAVLVDVPATW